MQKKGRTDIGTVENLLNGTEKMEIAGVIERMIDESAIVKVMKEDGCWERLAGGDEIARRIALGGLRRADDASKQSSRGPLRWNKDQERGLHPIRQRGAREKEETKKRRGS